MAQKFKKKSKVNQEIPTASMPDIIFMLLIFFMVTTVLKKFNGLPVRLPAAEKIGEIDSRIREGFEDALKEPEPPVSVVHDVSSFVEAKRRARSMHRSQFGEGGFFSRIPEALRDRLGSEGRV